jgi:hypothetical protein
MEDLRPGALLGVAGFAVMGAGLSIMTSSLQLIITFNFHSALVAAWPYGSMVLGMGLIVLGGKTAQGRDRAAFGAIAGCAAGVIFGMAWFIYAMTAGLFTLVSVFAIGMCVLGCILVPIGVPRAMKISAARRDILKDVEL